MTYEQLQDAIYTLIKGRTAREVVHEQQNVPRPAGAYVGISPLRVVRETEPERHEGAFNELDDSITQRVRAHWAVYADITCYRDAPAGLTAATEAWQMTRQVYVVDPAELATPLAFISAENIIDVGKLLGASIEPRHQFNARFRVAVNDDVVVPIIKNVNTTHEFKYIEEETP